MQTFKARLSLVQNFHANVPCLIVHETYEGIIKERGFAIGNRLLSPLFYRNRSHQAISLQFASGRRACQNPRLAL